MQSICCTLVCLCQPNTHRHKCRHWRDRHTSSFFSLKAHYSTHKIFQFAEDVNRSLYLFLCLCVCVSRARHEIKPAKSESLLQFANDGFYFYCNICNAMANLNANAIETNTRFDRAKEKGKQMIRWRAGDWQIMLTYFMDSASASPPSNELCLIRHRFNVVINAFGMWFWRVCQTVAANMYSLCAFLHNINM